MPSEQKEGCGVRILLAEDERSLSRAVTALLERNHYAVGAVYDGAEALDYLELSLIHIFRGRKGSAVVRKFSL